jgi:hypothetical protein
MWVVSSPEVVQHCDIDVKNVFPLGICDLFFVFMQLCHSALGYLCPCHITPRKLKRTMIEQCATSFVIEDLSWHLSKLIADSSLKQMTQPTLVSQHIS